MHLVSDGGRTVVATNQGAEEHEATLAGIELPLLVVAVLLTILVAIGTGAFELTEAVAPIRRRSALEPRRALGRSALPALSGSHPEAGAGCLRATAACAAPGKACAKRPDE